VHAAFNYWCHPPDHLASFEQPYTSPFWPRDWEERMAALTAGGSHRS